MYKDKIHCWMQINGYVDLKSIKAFYKKIEALSTAILKKKNIKKNELLVWALDIHAEEKWPVLDAALGLCEVEEMNLFMLFHLQSKTAILLCPPYLKEKPEYTVSMVIDFEGERPSAKYTLGDLTNDEMAEKISKDLKRFKTPKLGVDY